MKKIYLLLSFLLFLSCSRAQVERTTQLVGGPCEGCEAVLEYGDRKLSATDTLPDFHKTGQKIKIEGTIYQNDGITPAPGVILYVYHTNREGIYKPNENSKGWGKRHGYNRTWLQTDDHGHYAFYTIRPAPYPGRTEPAHIHYTVLEPNGKYYYLDSCHFAGDSLLTENEMNPDSPRGGSSGLLNLKKHGELWIANRDIILGKNIPEK